MEYYHVWMRGSNRYNVFYNKTDFTGFLQRCNKYAKEHSTSITGLVLMDNHVHLQVKTENLIPFIRSLLLSYNQWYNRRKDMTGKLFQSPFGHSILDTEEKLKKNLLYIFINPIKAGMCTKIGNYKWSSYHFLKSEKRNPIHKYIDLDTSVTKYFFKSSKEAIRASKLFILEEDYKIKTMKPTDSEVATHLKMLLDNRSLSEISREELIKIIKIIKNQSNATLRQLASVTHESYNDIRRMIK